MKKCSKCNAEIEDNARFCLYCMTSFDDKKEIKATKEKRTFLPVFIAVAALLLAFCITALLLLKSCNGGEQTADATGAKSTQNSDETPAETADETDKKPDNTDTGTKSETGNSSKQSNTSATTNSAEKSRDESTKNEEEITQTDTSVLPDSSTEYLRRDAKQSDDFYTAANTQNCVVITGIKTPSKTGEYIIPETIEGKKVIAVMGGAFSGDGVKLNVKKVTVSANVKTIWNYAFGGCNNLTDIYFCGNSIYTEAFAFAITGERAGTFTIHCSSACSDRNYRYYKTTAPNYDAVWKEWNG